MFSRSASESEEAARYSSFSFTVDSVASISVPLFFLRTGDLMLSALLPLLPVDEVEGVILRCASSWSLPEARRRRPSRLLIERFLGTLGAMTSKGRTDG